ncbi:MAG: radical SAM protein [Candidatus Diapherotrites archaeon]|uniref:Radical SAM protein n=1 Tax=Candidatus Iainarchaeum sp. TaxID=3101447 RepID=A0A8T4L3Q6_9ARCH|nr:radical SAM protein [Candidatus Diapherotrites archaeon]
MKPPKINRYGSFALGPKRDACIDCLQGKKMVIFITGICNKHCFYCPVSDEKMRRDNPFANERPLRNGHEIEDLRDEAHAMNATGASITGGDPLTKIDRCVEYITALKKEFGPTFHIHLYTWGTFATPENVKKLEKAGLDEIRFHLFKDPDFDRILPALKTKMQVTVEVPCIPTKENEKELFEMVEYMKHHRLKYLNLNELEFSDANFDRLLDTGFKQANDIEYRAKGSLQLAFRVADRCRPEINVNFCSSANKSFLQIGQRMKRRAENTKKPFENVNSDGMIEKYAVEGPGLTQALAEKIVSQYGKMIRYNPVKKRLETNEQNAKKIAKKYHLLVAFILEMPAFEPWDVEKIPLNA